MEDFPRIRMRSRIKFYNEGTADFSIGTIMSRLGAYTYKVRFEDVDRIVSLKDMSTWKFDQTPPRQGREEFLSQSSAQNISANDDGSSLHMVHILQQSTIGKPLHPTLLANRVQPNTSSSVAESTPEPYLWAHHAQKNTRFPLTQEPEIQRNQEIQENAREVTLGEDSSPPNLDLSPQTVTDNHQSRRTSAKSPRKTNRSCREAAFKKQKRMKFGSPSTFHFDPKADRNGKDTSMASKVVVGSEISRDCKTTPTRNALLRSRSGKKAHAKPSEANPRKVSSSIDDDEVIGHSSETERHRNHFPNVESTSFSEAAEHEMIEPPSECRKNTSTLVTNTLKIDEDKDDHMRLTRPERLSKSKETRHLPRISRLKPRDSLDRVAKASNQVENLSLSTLKRAIQQKQFNMTGVPHRVNKCLTCGKSMFKMICKPEKMSGELEEQEKLQLEKKVPLQTSGAETVRRELVSTIADTAARKTREVINDLGKANRTSSADIDSAIRGKYENSNVQGKTFISWCSVYKKLTVRRE